jgi:hypothetical protein
MRPNKPWKWWMHVMVYTKIVTIWYLLSTCSSLMHPGGYLKYILWWKFVINDDLCPNLSLCSEISAHMNDLIVQQLIFLFTNFWNIIMIATKELTNISFNNNLYMKFYIYKKANHKKPSSFSKHSLFLEVIESRSNDIKCSLIH